MDCFLEHDTSVYAIYGAALMAKLLEDKSAFKKLNKQLLTRKIASPISYMLCADLNEYNSKKYIAIINKGTKKMSEILVF